MSLTTYKQGEHMIGNGRVTHGTATFNGTDTSGTIASKFKRYGVLAVSPLQAPATVTREVFIPLGTVAATTTFNIITPPYAGSLVSAKLAVTTAITRDDTNFYGFALLNKGTDGTGTNDMIITATDVNKTKLTFLNLLAFTPTDLTVHGTAANLAFSASSNLLFTATKNGTAANLVAAGLILNFNVGDIGEAFYFNEAAHSSNGAVTPSSGVLTIARSGPAQTSGALVSFKTSGY
jgi:hypothetical protein